MARKQRASGGSERTTSSGQEWIGGRLLTPFHIMEGGAYRPEVILWLEMPSGLVVGSYLVDPAAPPVSFAQTLRDAMHRPLAGSPRRPRCVRVADAAHAVELEAALGTDIPVQVAPTPELDRLIEAMAASMPESDEDQSYLEEGRVSTAAVAKLFRAAELLYEMAPWKFASDEQVLRMDIPQLGVEGACVSIIGAMDEYKGLVIFPSLAGYDNFVGAELAEHEDGPLDVGTTFLSLTFARGADLPPSMQREVAEQGWPVAAADAYPVVERRDRDGVSCPLNEGEVRIAAACASALIAFFVRHRENFEEDSPEPVCESFTDDEDLTVRFTVPYEAAPLFDVSDSPVPAAHGAKVGRNDPCPCGSGRKYKKCHFGSDRGGSG